MSHFTVMVIGEDPEGQLEPFSEHIELPRYKVGKVSFEELSRFVEHYAPQHLDEKITTEELYKLHGVDWNGNMWKKNSDGNWDEWSTYNPNSKWDWYQLGGRWSGRIQLKEGATSGTVGAAGVFGNEIGIDQALLGEIANINELTTFAVLKDGEWFEQGQMGWFGMSSNDKNEEDWEAEVRSLLEGLPDDTLISMYDCHI